jgi:hypothetical protein
LVETCHPEGIRQGCLKDLNVNAEIISRPCPA